VNSLTKHGERRIVERSCLGAGGVAIAARDEALGRAFAHEDAVVPAPRDDRRSAPVEVERDLVEFFVVLRPCLRRT